MDLDILEKAIMLLQKHGLTELSYESSGSSICIKKESPAVQITQAQSPIATSPQQPTPTDGAKAPANAQPETSTTAVKAPLVGTFYRATDPNAAPLCSAGQVVKKGDPVGLIEAMKVLTTISAPCGGTILEICVENGAVVEYGQPLIHITP